MKLHLPKQLFSALLTAITLAAAPLAITLGSNAWGEWSGQYTKDTYYLTGQDDIKTSESSSSNTNIFLKPRTTQDKSATISSLTLNKSGCVLIITGEWFGNYDFTALTINQMTVSADNTSLKIGGNQNSNASQTVTIQKIDGDKTLTKLEVTQWGNLTIGAATLSSVINDGTLNLRGTLTGAGGGAAISGGTVNVDVDALSIMNFEGYHFTDFDGNALANSAIHHGFLKGTQTLTVFKNISVTNASGTAANLTNGQYTYKNEDSTFYVNDSWIFNADESSGASAYYVGANGVFEYYTESDITHAASISGDGTLRKSGSGTLTLNTNATLGTFEVAGGKTILTGNLILKNLLMSGGKLEVSSGGVLDLTGTSYSFNTKNSTDFQKLLTTLNTNNQVTTHGEGYIKVDGTPSGDISMQSDMKLRTNMVTTDKFVLHGRSWDGPIHSNGHILTIDEGAHLQIGESESKELELVGRATINLVNGSSLTAGTLTLGYSSDQTPTSWGKLSINSGSSAKLSNIVYRQNAGNTFEMTNGSVEFTTKENIIVRKDDNSVGNFVISGGEWVVNQDQNLTQVSGLTVSLGNVDMDIAAGKTLTLGGEITITGALTHNSAGTLKFADNTSLSLTTSALDSLRKVGVGITDPDDNGDGFGTLGYYLVNGTGEVTSGTGMRVTVGGSSDGYTFTNGIISSSSEVYVINSTTKNTGNVSAEAKAFHVNKGGVFTLNGDITGELTLSHLLTTTTGEGTLVLGQDFALEGATHFGGTLQIEKGAQLKLGTGQTTSVNVTSFDKIVLNGGEIRYAAKASSINAIEVIQNSHFVVFDTNGETNQLTLGSVSIAGGSTFFVNSPAAREKNSWKQNLYIGSLSGAGKADIYGTKGNNSNLDGDSQISYVTINSLEDFKGSLSITSRVYNEVDNRYKATVNTGTTGADFEKLEFSGFKLTGYDAVFNVQSNTSVDTITADAATLTAGTFKVNLSEGVTLTLGGDTASTSTLGTVVAHSAGNTIYLNEMATLNTLSFGQDSGDVTLAGSGTYELSDNTITMTTGVSLDLSWSGTVKMQNVVKNDDTSKYSIAKMAETAANGKLLLTNVNGWLGEASISTDLILKNDTVGNAGLIISNGSSLAGNLKSSVFEGDISGSGDMKFAWDGGAQNAIIGHTFNGDTSEWSGKFISGAENANKDVVVDFTKAGDVFSKTQEGGGVVNESARKLTVKVGNADGNTDFNGSITNIDTAGVTHGKINLDVKGNTNFKGAVNVTELTTTTGKKVEFHADTTVAGNVTAGGTSGGTIHVEDGTFTVGGTLSARDQKLNLELSGASTRVGQGTEGKTTAKIRLEGTGNTVGTLDFGKNGYARGVLELGEDSSTTAGALYMNNGVSISLEKDAALTIGDSKKNYHYTITGRGVGAQIGIAKGDALSENSPYRGQFGENKDVKYILSNVDVNVNKASADNILAYELDNSSLTNAGSDTLTVSNANNTITHLAADGGNVTLSESMSVNSISAKNEKVVTVDSGKTIGMAGGKVQLSTREGANATLTAKSDNALLQLQADTSFSISDMTLSGVKISADAGTEVVLRGVDTTGGVELAAGQFTMGDTVSLSEQEPAAKSGGYTASFSSDQLSGITLNNAGGAATLTVDLGSLPGSLTMGQTYDRLTITLYGFTMDYTSGEGLIFAEDSWLGRMLKDQNAVYVNGGIDSHEVAALANNNTVKVEFRSAVENGANVGTVIRITGLTIPEPATSTLGLIALAALVTRRRRK